MPVNKSQERVPSREHEIIFRLAEELASEIELHYETDEYYALTPTMEALREASEVLSEAGHSLPSVVNSVLEALKRQRQ